MSLIHSALKEIERVEPGSFAPQIALAPAPPARRSGSALGLIAGVAIVAAIGAGWWLSSTGISQPAAPEPQTPAAATPEPAPASALPPSAVPLPSEPQAAPPAATPAASTPAARAPVPQEGPALRPVKAVARPAAAPRKPVARPAAVAPAAPQPEPEPEPVPVEQIHAEVMTAVAAGDLPAARARLVELALRLPSDNLALLRARAWVSARGGAPAEAMRDYQAILQRLPGDENASLNLAALEAAAGQPEAARATLSGALSRFPESERLQRALTLLDGGAR